MRITLKDNLTQKAIFIAALLVSTICSGHGGYGGGGGGYYHGHGGGGYYHGGGGGYYHGHGGYYGGGPGIVIGVPLGGYYGPRYYPPVCETVRVCNSVGQCWLQQECD